MPIIIPGNRLASTGHTISQSIRFNDDDSPYMSRTQQAGNQTTWTISCWVKIGNIPGNFTIWSVHTGYQSYAQIRSIGGLEFAVGNGSSSASYHRLTRLLRDPSAWYHLVMVFDSTNAASSERARIYINGERQLDFSNTGSWSQSYSSNVNSTQTMYIGEQGTGGNHMDGYIAEFVQIDGQALDPSNFAETNSSGIWVPKDISGLTFGTNGCHIDGRDASDLGDDESGNGNDFATSGLAAHDQVLDSPTNNFATINPLDWSIRNAANSVPLSEGNLKFTGSDSTGVYGTYYTTIQVPSTGSWYFELVPTAIGSAEKQSQYIYVGSVGFLANGNTNAGAYGSAWSAGDIIGVAVNSTGVWFSINGTYQNSGNPATGSNPAGTTSLPGAILIGDGSATTNSSSTGVLNFGQDGTFAGNKTAQGNKDSSGIGNFYYSPPSGFKALCTKNLGS